ncbi:MAG: pyridoxamine 5'-phosphate oxidase family protein [Pseudomonadota bacterium]|nr:pyridoxamine 5'-phosphate oxidase family protein [Pseudomonadota bacterium]
MSKTQTPQETLWHLIKDMKFGMFTHRHADGQLHAHPLTTQNRSLDEAGLLYFFVSKKTELGQRVQADGNVCVTYGDPGKDTWVSISGTARVNDDRATKERLFNPIVKAWFPGGLEDPNLELVEVKINHAEYWNITESKMTQLLKMTTAAVTGTPPKMGEHRELNLG